MTEIPPRLEITLDQQVALRTAANRLVHEFEGTFNAATIERYLHSSYDRLAGAAKVVTFPPLLAERFARQRLDALTRVVGLHHDRNPVVLFLGVHNAGRSQMALGFFHHYAHDAAIAWTGGSAPVSAINTSAIAAMAERDIDISGEYPKPWTDEVIRAADVVITMGCRDACPVFPGKRCEEWTLGDPPDLDVAQVRPVRDEIERRVLALLAELHIPTHAKVGPSARSGTDE